MFLGNWRGRGASASPLEAGRQFALKFLLIFFSSCSLSGIPKLSSEQIARIDREGFAKPRERPDRRIHFTRLDFLPVTPVHRGAMAGFFQRQASVLASVTDIRGKATAQLPLAR